MIDFDVEDINNRILDLWEEEFKQETSEKVLVPLLFNNFNKNGLLTIGMNPSFSETGFKSYVKEYTNINQLFTWNSKEETLNKIKNINELDMRSKTPPDGYKPFFKPFWKLMESLGGVNWDHIDLFFYRKTDQQEFLKQPVMIKEKRLTPFAIKQLEIVRDIIRLVNPKIILVANSGASDIFKKHFEKHIVFDKQLGTYTFKLANEKIPIFFSAMLSNGALDKHSYERLKWHMREVLGQNV